MLNIPAVAQRSFKQIASDGMPSFHKHQNYLNYLDTLISAHKRTVLWVKAVKDSFRQLPITLEHSYKV